MQIKILQPSNFIFQLTSILTSHVCGLAAPSDFCQDA
jgi:hypothetical protein